MKISEAILWIAIAFVSIKYAKIDSNIKIINDYRQGGFSHENNLPLQNLIAYALSEFFSLESVYFLYYVLRNLCFINGHFSTTFYCILFSTVNFNPSLASIFMMYSVFTEKVLFKSIFIGLALSSDVSGAFLILLILVQYILECYNNLLDIKQSVFYTLVRSICKALCIILIASGTYLLIFYIDYSIRDTIINPEETSLEFAANFKNKSLQPTHQNVISNSTVTIINKHHKHFLGSLDNKVMGCVNLQENSVWRIIKIEGEISNNNLVKLYNIKSRKFLAITNVNSVDKFLELSLVEKELDDSKNEVFRIECEGELKARQTAFKICHNNSGLYLGMRNLYSDKKEVINAYGSIYSNKKHRIFYIADNDTGDLTPKKHLNYPKLSFLECVSEQTKMIIKNNKGLVRVLNIHNKLYRILVLLIPVYALTKTVLSNRRRKQIDYNTNLVYMYIFALLLTFVYCGDDNLLLVTQVIVNYLFMQQIHNIFVYIYLSISVADFIRQIKFMQW